MSPLNALIDLLRIPSVSTDPSFHGECLRAADYLSGYLSSLGFSVSLLPGRTNPAVFASSPAVSGKPTVLIYGHYDVQPAGAPSAWTTPAFEPSIRKNRVYARGATDNKGQLMIHVHAARRLVEQFGLRNLPLNIKFYIEGEEEIGSSSVTDHLTQYPDLLRADYVVISDTEMLAPGKPSLDTSLRGVVDMEISIQTGSHDLHSGQFGGLAPNPALIMARLLAGLKNGRGKILLPGFYSDVIPPTKRQLEDLRSLSPDTKSILREGHFFYLGGGDHLLPLNRRRWYEPTFDVTGLDSGYTGQGTKTIIPSVAEAKLSMRLVPDQNPYKIYTALVSYFQKRVSKKSVLQISMSDIALPYRAPVSHPVYRFASDCLRHIYGHQATFVGQGGSIGFVPVMAKTLNVPCVLIGFGLPDENLHAPNEHFSLDNYYKGIEVMTYFYSRLHVLKNKPVVVLDKPQKPVVSYIPI